MKLYYFPGACSLSPHIVAREAGLAFELVKVDPKTKTIAGGKNFLDVNPKGQVPALALDSGEVLTEGPAIVQYLADQNPGSGLAPAAGTLARYRLQEWLNFVTAELHKNFTPLFKENTPAAYKTVAKANLADRMQYLDRHLADRPFLLGDQFTVADAYAYAVLNWSRLHQIDLNRWPNLKAYFDRVRKRPKVQEALAAEGLLSAPAAAAS